MKKARIFLSAVVVLAITGGALAFKPAKFTQANVFCPLDNSQAANRCPLQSDKTTQFDADATLFPSYDCPAASVTGFYTATVVTTVGTEVYTTCTGNIQNADVYSTVVEP